MHNITICSINNDGILSGCIMHDTITKTDKSHQHLRLKRSIINSALSVQGVSRKVRVLQVTPTKAMAAGGSGSSGSRPAAGSGVVRAVVAPAPTTTAPTTAAAASTAPPAAGSRVIQPTIVRPSGSGNTQLARASGSGVQLSAVGPAVQPGARVPMVRVVQRAVQPSAAAGSSAGGSGGGTSAATAAATTVRMVSVGGWEMGKLSVDR